MSSPYIHPESNSGPGFFKQFGLYILAFVANFIVIGIVVYAALTLNR